MTRDMSRDWPQTYPANDDGGGEGVGHSKMRRSSIVGEWYPPGGVIILEFLCCFQVYLRWECGMQRTPGDQVTIEKRTKKNYRRVCSCGERVISKEGARSSALCGSRPSGTSR